MASEERKLRFGNNPMRIARNKYFRKKSKVMVGYIPAVITHPKAIVGTTITRSPQA
jgi:hypothetical protein